jgi:hypothetical protein
MRYAKPAQLSLWTRLVAQQMLCDRRRECWPKQLHATDLDSLGDEDSIAMLEYYRAHEVALVDYKWRLPGFDARLNSSAIAIQRSFARKAQVPFYVAQYYEADWSFRWTRLDNLYKQPVWNDTDETGWVRLQMKLRGMELDPKWTPAPIRNRPRTFQAIAGDLLRMQHDPSAIAAFLSRLEQEYS